MKRSVSRAVGVLAAAAVFGMLGCSKPEAKNETVALVNGDAIKVVELREFLGVRGGLTPAVGIRAEKKKEALDRLIAGRLLEQEARAKGLDNTDEFRGVVKSSEQSALITALFRKELASKEKGTKEEIEAEAKKMMAADNTLSRERAHARAGRMVSSRQTRKIEEELIGAANKEFPSQIIQDTVDRIAKGENVPDDAVLATTASDNVTYGDVKRVLERVGGGIHGVQDMARNPGVVVRVRDREVAGKALAAYARKHGVEGSEWHKAVRGDIDRSILIELLVEKIVKDEVQVTDEEIEAAYKAHPERFVRGGKAIPLKAVKEDIRGALQKEKREAAVDARIADLRKNAKITIDEKALSGA